MSDFFDKIKGATARIERRKKLTFGLYSVRNVLEDGNVIFSAPIAFKDDHVAFASFKALLDDGTLPKGSRFYRVGCFCHADGRLIKEVEREVLHG